jgi:NADP-dependent 3-hydroxy acid dehydrogenase YdfG
VDDTLAGRSALVTGAGSGVGRAIALALVDHGVRVGLVGRNPGALEAVAAEARDAASARRYPGDITVDRDVERIVHDAVQDFAAIDILVHSAGLIRLGEVERLPVEEMDRHYAVNVRAPYLLTQRLLPALRARRGHIVFINSTAGLEARGKAGPYAASKHALRALADSLRDEVNESGVRVLSVFLGRTATAMQEAVHRMEERPYRPELLMQPDDVAAAVLGCLRLPRRAEVTELRMRPQVKSY